MLTPTTLTLMGVSGHTIWFTDRPVRKLGLVSTGIFVEQTWAAGGGHSFDQVAPNAAVIDGTTTINSLQEVRADILELSHPVYDAKNQTLSYKIHYLNKAKIPATTRILLDASVFIDGVPCMPKLPAWTCPSTF